MLVITISKIVFCDSHFTIITACYRFALYVMQDNLDFYDNHDGDEFIQYKKCKHEHKMLV